ncbi:MAG: AmmeMemoRadiSam system radical SAM enzyme [Deltaproteobacteria bacterium]|nr:AmmeMemoRadiSam system radical SAM enzyme [Deltaproteobacteria bacterium]MBW2680738.1 AmmeMemoRadiSam system radical SAM enzyme [Deltaproteobacteria bacterium]
MNEAMLYGELAGNEVACNLCNHRCKIKEGRRGICGVRENRGGKLYSLVYGKIISEHIDPIEKKPLFNFLPGSRAFSIGTVGCNFRCKHCQNSDISQYPHEHGGGIIGHDRTPDQIVTAAKAAGCETIAYTYNEPTIFYEFAYDTAVLAQKEGIKNVFVSNGYMSSEAARQIAPYLDAINIDLKAFTDKFYKQVCGARLNPVLETILLMKELDVWVEVTTLIIPGLNDGERELRNIARFVKNVGRGIPWHVSQFYPTYKLVDRPSTPVATLRRAREIGMEEGLHYVYEGNVIGEKGENTYCYVCGGLLIERYGLTLTRNYLQDGKCPECGARIDGFLPTTIRADTHNLR